MHYELLCSLFSGDMQLINGVPTNKIK